MNLLKKVIGFVPFVLFSVLTPVLGGGWAAASGAAVALVVVAATARGGIKSLPVVQAVILLVLALLGFIGDEHVKAVLVTYGPAIAALLMGMFMIETARTRPFTAQLSRGDISPELWQNSKFRDKFMEVNRRVSIAWGLAVLVVGLAHIVGALIGVESMNLLVRLAVNWALPIFAFKQAVDYTKHTVAAAHGQQEKLQDRLQERKAS